MYNNISKTAVNISDRCTPCNQQFSTNLTMQSPNDVNFGGILYGHTSGYRNNNTTVIQRIQAPSVVLGVVLILMQASKSDTFLFKPPSSSEIKFVLCSEVFELPCSSLRCILRGDGLFTGSAACVWKWEPSIWHLLQIESWWIQCIHDSPIVIKMTLFKCATHLFRNPYL